MAERNYLLLTLRVSSVALLALLLTVLSHIYNPEIYNVINVLSIIGMLRDIFAFLLYILLFYLMSGLYFVGLGILTLFKLNSSFYSTLSFNIFQNLVGRWFKFTFVDSSISTTSPTVEQATQGLSDLFAAISSDLYFIGLQILVIAMFYYALRGAITSNPGDSVKVILFLNAVIAIPLFILQLVSLLQLFDIQVTSLPEWFQNIVNHDLLYSGIFLDISQLSLWEFLSTDIFIVGVLEFAYLEFVFQLAYVDKVTRPSIEREERLNHQIEVMHIEAQKAIARIKAIEERKRELKMEARASLSEEERERQKQEKERLSLHSLMSESGEQVGFSYVAELIRKKKAEREEAKIMGAMRDTRKIANYLDKLFKQDPEAKAALTASSSAPKSSRLVFSTVVNMFVRIVIITAMAWASVHPYQFFNLIGAPDSILKSVELQIYEGSWSIIIPLVLLIPLISYIIRITKNAKLEEILRLEAIRRAGLTEEEYEALQSQREQQLSEEEVQLARDKDAMADQAKKAAI
ncbi:hypothetical protein [Candidatus Harpocratesius sp.]